MHTVSLKKWGNSLGVIIPREDIKAINAYVGEQFEVITHPDGSITLKPVQDPHKMWQAAFNTMADTKSDQLLWQELGTEFDKDEWTW